MASRLFGGRDSTEIGQEGGRTLSDCRQELAGIEVSISERQVRVLTLTV